MTKKNPAAVELGRLGGIARGKSLSAEELSDIGKKGARTRTKTLTAAQRSEIAKKAVAAREAKRKKRRSER